jgi:hypothetical protein
MPDPEVNKKYKHYKGNIYKVVLVQNETVYLMKDNCMYQVGLDYFNTPVTIENNVMIQRFTEYKRGK